MTWPVGNWLAVAVLAFVPSVALLTWLIADYFRGWRVWREGRSIWWGPDHP